jgi:5-methyltetrahydropteroyltriglutamate--homocysteine methyltransferase
MIDPRMRVDHVGSLLRPPELVAMTLGTADRPPAPAGEISAAQDTAIREAIDRQQSIGLPFVTDGEFRRRNFQDSFGEVAGAERLWSHRKASVLAPEAVAAPGSRAPDAVAHSVAATAPVTEPLKLRRNRPLSEFRFAQSVASVPVKITLISVDRIRERIDFAGSRELYSSDAELMDAVVAASREIVSGLVEAGCRYIQIDGPNYTRFVDPDSLDAIRAAGEEPMDALDRAIAWDNAVIEGFDDVTFGLHVCRGNRRSMWHRSGTYDAIAERLFNGLAHQRLLLEYDSPRAGTFDPLRFVPADKTVVLGLISTKIGSLEDREAIRRRIEEASRHVPLEQLALSPQCGFGSDIQGNQLGIDEQWRKLELVTSLAADTWG